MKKCQKKKIRMIEPRLAAKYAAETKTKTKTRKKEKKKCTTYSMEIVTQHLQQSAINGVRCKIQHRYHTTERVREVRNAAEKHTNWTVGRKGSSHENRLKLNK